MDQSVGPQTGIQWPTEDLSERSSPLATSWAVRIRKKNATRNCRMELFVDGNVGPISNNVPQGSLLVPADADGAISVGAVHWSNDQREPYHVYSSQGPTKDGRIKPEFSAPSGVIDEILGDAEFLRDVGVDAACRRGDRPSPAEDELEPVRGPRGPGGPGRGPGRSGKRQHLRLRPRQRQKIIRGTVYATPEFGDVIRSRNNAGDVIPCHHSGTGNHVPVGRPNHVPRS